MRPFILAEDTYRKRNVLLIGVLEQAWNESGARFVIRELLRVFWNWGFYSSPLEKSMNR